MEKNYISFHGKIIGFLASLLMMQAVLAVFFVTEIRANNLGPVVKVAYFENEGFSEGTSDEERKSGYAYEYLQKVASYTGWIYEYVYVDWEQGYDLLAKGQVDLMAGIPYSEERAKEVGFPSYSMDPGNYLCVAKEDVTLLKELNEALSELALQEPYYLCSLQEKFAISNFTSAALTQEEEAYFKEHKSVHIGILDGYEPFTCVQDSEAAGALVDVIKNIWELCEIPSELDFVSFADYGDMLDALKSGELDLALPLYADSWYAEEYGFLYSNEICNLVLNLMYLDKPEILENEVIAVSKNSPFQKDYISLLYPENKILLCKNEEACVRAVERGKAQAAIITTYQKNVFLTNTLTLKTIPIDSGVGICMATDRENRALISAMNRGLSVVGKSGIEDALIIHADETYQITMSGYIAEHWPLFFTLLALFFFIVILMITDFARQMVKKEREIRRNQNELEVQRTISHTDELTGLGNRRAYEEDIRLLKEHGTSEDMIFFSVDINELKQVNDSLGHAAGDELIIGTAEVLKEVWGACGKIYRIGGDEFVAILYSNRSGSDLKADLMRIYKKWHGEMVDKMALSCGFASVKEYPEASVQRLVEISDGQMYRSKEMYYRRTGKDRRK